MYLCVTAATIIFDVIVTFMLFDASLKWKEIGLVKKVSVGVFVFCITLLNNILIKNLICTILISVSVLLLASIMGFEGKINKKILVVLGYMLLVIISDLITTVLEMIFLNSDTNALLQSESNERIIGMIVSKPVVLLLVRIVIMIAKKENMQIYRHCSTVLLSVPIVNILLILSIVNFYESIQLENFNAVYIVSICVLYNTISIFYLFERITHIASLENKCNILENQMIIQEQHERNKEAYHDKIKAYKHDLKIHFQTLYSMLLKGFSDKAKIYLKSTGLVDEVEYCEVHTGNVAFDAILNSKLSEAEQKEISTEIYCCLPGDIEMSDVDIAVLFGNLIDNAIEACQRADSLYKDIVVKIQYNKNRLSCYIKNTAQSVKKEGNRFVSLKKEKEQHGIGLQNIENIVLKYGGICKMVHEQGYFKTYITLFV